MLHALGMVLAPDVLLVVIAAAAFGLFVGSIPGSTATMATALLVPMTFFMDPVPAIAAMVTASAMATTAGDIPSALLRMPGTPASAAYVDEAYLMTQRGEAEYALGICLVTSVIGGLFGSAVLIFTAPMLAEFALNFSSFEYFWLALLGLTCAAIIASDSPLKGALSLLIGLAFATVGIDPTAGHPRFTFGQADLMGGLGLIPVMVGLFAVAEIMRFYAGSTAQLPPVQHSVGNIFSGMGTMVWKLRKTILHGNIIGTVIGALPGAGADIAAWVSYAYAKKVSKSPEKFGTGHDEGLASAGAANNAALSGAYVPAVVFGIPGDTITAIVIGVLYMKGLNPGPTVFIKNPEMIYAIFFSFFLANLLMLPLGWAAIKSAKQILRVPLAVLMPCVLMFSIVGAFAAENTMFAALLIMAFGIIGFLFSENDIPVAPFVLGIVLGPLLEQSFMTSMMKSGGSLVAFFDRPIAGSLGVFTLIVLFWPIARTLLARRRRPTMTATPKPPVTAS